MSDNSIYLRALDSSDLERVLRWHNDAALYETLGGAFRPVSRESEQEWLRKKTVYSSTELSLAICTAQDSQHIGNIYLRNIDWIARNAELHIFIGEMTQRRKGYGSAAVKWLVQYAFNQLGLVRIYLFVLSDNAMAVRMYQRCGFRIEGNLRSHAFKNGKFSDMTVMGICLSDNQESANHET